MPGDVFVRWIMRAMGFRMQTQSCKFPQKRSANVMGILLMAEGINAMTAIDLVHEKKADAKISDHAEEGKHGQFFEARWTNLISSCEFKMKVYMGVRNLSWFAAWSP